MGFVGQLDCVYSGYGNELRGVVVLGSELNDIKETEGRELPFFALHSLEGCQGLTVRFLRMKYVA